MHYRRPTAADIGKPIEVLLAGDWRKTTLLSVTYSRDGVVFQCDGYRSWDDAARIPCDPSELLVAADLCADHGLGLAEDVLRREAGKIVTAGIDIGKGESWSVVHTRTVEPPGDYETWRW